MGSWSPEGRCPLEVDGGSYVETFVVAAVGSAVVVAGVVASSNGGEGLIPRPQGPPRSKAV